MELFTRSLHFSYSRNSMTLRVCRQSSYHMKSKPGAYFWNQKLHSIWYKTGDLQIWYLFRLEFMKTNFWT